MAEYIDKTVEQGKGYEDTNVGSYPLGSLPLNDVVGYLEVNMFEDKKVGDTPNFNDEVKDE